MLATILTLHTLASKVAEAPLPTEELPKELPTEQPKVVPKPWEPATSLPEGIKHLEGIVRKGGMHRVYDDENKNYVWDGVTPYKQWAKGLTGKPTVGHGNRFEYLSEDTRNKIIAAGGATDTLADQAMIDHLKWQEPILRKRFPDHGQVIKLPPPPATLQDVLNNQPIQDVGKPSKNTYTIKAGDTLSHIAKALGISWQDIQSVNPTLNPNRLKIGQTIQLPDSKQPTKPYTIAEGDTLSGIAQRHNTTWQNIAKLNPGINPNRIKPNQQINVPSK